MSEPWSYLNGQWLPAREAAIPIYDAGFVLGATITEQFRTFGGKLFRPEQHWERMLAALETVRVTPDQSPDELDELARELVARNHALLDGGDDLGLSVFVTPGAYATLAPEGSNGGPTVGMSTYPLPFRIWAVKYDEGVSLSTTSVEQVSPRSWPPDLKCRSRMHYYLADLEAHQREPGSRALMLDAAGMVRETSTSNIVAYSRERGVVGPPRDTILPGISLAALIDLLCSVGIEYREEELRVDDLLAADEVWLASTPSCMLAVAQVNGHAIGGGRPGPTYRRLLSAWSRQVGIDIVAQAQRFAVRNPAPVAS